MEQAEGIFYGFYYTFDLQRVLQKDFTEESNMQRAINAKPLEDSFKERCRSFVSPVWCAIVEPLEALWDSANLFVRHTLPAFCGFGSKSVPVTPSEASPAASFSPTIIPGVSEGGSKETASKDTSKKYCSIM
ncbi:MAG: hypothetical protein HON55_04800 [Legionellales bacterium]|nr:hypothetical protein [Legionellales bacterium]